MLGEITAMRILRDGHRVACASLTAGATLALLAGGSGCASCPCYEDRNWRELSTQNFRLRTDLGADQARAQIEELELFRAAILTSFRASPMTPTGQLPVVVLDAGWGAVGGPLLHGIFGRMLFTRQIAMRASNNLLGQTVVKHEIVHYLSNFVRPSDPRWLAEGLATYFETLELSDDHHVVTVGRPDPQDVSSLRGLGIISVGELMSGAEYGSQPALFQASAWLLVHYLMNHHNVAFRSYLKALATNSDHTQAWTASFGGLGPEQLDQELRRYFDGGRYYLYKFPFQPPPVQIADQRTLSPATAHATRALLYAVVSRRIHSDLLPNTSEGLRACAAQELALVFHDDPDHPLGLAVKTWELGEEIEVARARRSAEHAATDWLAWWLLAATLRRHGIDDQGAAMAEDKAASLAAGNPAIELKAVRHVKGTAR
jgi:hypothetical protein